MNQHNLACELLHFHQLKCDSSSRSLIDLSSFPPRDEFGSPIRVTYPPCSSCCVLKCSVLWSVFPKALQLSRNGWVHMFTSLMPNPVSLCLSYKCAFYAPPKLMHLLNSLDWTWHPGNHSRALFEMNKKAQWCTPKAFTILLHLERTKWQKWRLEKKKNENKGQSKQHEEQWLLRPPELAFNADSDRWSFWP